MNFNNSACFGYGSSVTNPSFNETILKYFLQKYRMSFLHLFNSLARSLNCYGVNISFSPAFLIVASSLFESPFDTLLLGFMGLFNSSYIFLNLSKFKSLNLSIYTGSIMLFYNTAIHFLLLKYLPFFEENENGRKLLFPTIESNDELKIKLESLD